MPNAGNCVHCQRPLTTGHFEITRVDATGAMRVQTYVCSLVCMVQWAYAYTTARGVQGFLGLRDAVRRLVDSVKGPRTGG